LALLRKAEADRSASPGTGQDDPATCVEPPGPEEKEKRKKEWEREMWSRVAETLPKLADCHRATEPQAKAYVEIVLEFDGAGNPVKQRIVESSPGDCEVAECVKGRLGALRAPAGSADGSWYSAGIGFRLGREPRLVHQGEKAHFGVAIEEEARQSCESERASERVRELLPGDIQATVRSRYGKLRVCYERGLLKNPNLAGRLEVRFTISGTGAVSRVRVAANTMPDCDTVRCMVGVFRALRFPETGNPQEVTVVYPIQFSPG
jgi:hypothetical protein